MPLGEETADTMRILGPALMGNPRCDFCHQPINPERENHYKIERHYRPARRSRNNNVDTNFFYHEECYKILKGPAGESNGCDMSEVFRNAHPDVCKDCDARDDEATK